MNPLYYSAIYLLIINLAAFGLYWKDKRAARSSQWRIRESTLHLSSLLGGWPLALLAQIKLRHKTKKTGFRVVYLITVFIHISITVFLYIKFIHNAG